MATPPPAPPSQGFPNPKSHQGTGGSPSGWLHRRKKNVADVAGVIGDIAHILHQRHEHMRLHRVATEPNRQGIQQAHNEHVQYSRAYVEMHDALKKKAKFSNVCDEIIGEIKHKRVHIDATYRAETIGLHAWNPLDWGALAAASGKHTLSVVKHHLEVAAAHVWTPGAIARHTQYKTQLRDLGRIPYSGDEPASTNDRTTQGRDKAASRNDRFHASIGHRISS